MCGLSLRGGEKLLPDGKHCLDHVGKAIVISNLQEGEEITMSRWEVQSSPNPGVLYDPKSFQEMHPAFLELTPEERGVPRKSECLVPWLRARRIKLR